MFADPVDVASVFRKAASIDVEYDKSSLTALLMAVRKPVDSVPSGLDLETWIIAHSVEVQKQMDARHISWGVQYEIARGVSCGGWKWSDVTPDKLDKLRGTAAEAAPKVRQTILSLADSSTHSSTLW